MKLTTAFVILVVLLIASALIHPYNRALGDILLAFFVLFFIYSLFVVPRYYYRRYRAKKLEVSVEDLYPAKASTTPSLNLHFIEKAKEAERAGDYLAARVNYMKCMEDLKRSGAPEEVILYAQQEYDNFVRRDPIFKELLSRLILIIEKNPGILQSEITRQFDSMDWPALYSYDRPVAKDDIYYALYFAARFGIIKRLKKGRSYQLFMSNNKEG